MVEVHRATLGEGLLSLARFCGQRMKDGGSQARLESLASKVPTLWQGPGLATDSMELEGALDLLISLEAALKFLEGRSYFPPGSLEGEWLGQVSSLLANLETRLESEVRARLRARLFGLYAIIDPQVTGGRDVLEVARSALEGGARVLQLRDKERDKGQVLPLALALGELCKEHEALLIINDHADLAVAAGADGVHLGQQDLPIAEARKVLRPHQLVGRSNALLEEALESEAQGADYVAVGSIYPTSTKGKTRPAGLETLRRVKERVAAPVVAIGGINEGNVEAVVKAGADSVCVLSAVGMAPDPRKAAQRLVEAIRAAGGRA